MSSYLQDNAQDEAVNLSDENHKFKIAITIEDFLEPDEMKNDPRYTKWLFRLLTK